MPFAGDTLLDVLAARFEPGIAVRALLVAEALARVLVQPPGRTSVRIGKDVQRQLRAEARGRALGRFAGDENRAGAREHGQGAERRIHLEAGEITRVEG